MKLGRGLEVLLGPGNTSAASAEDADAPAGPPIRRVPVDALRAGRYQPRRQASKSSLAELADSIREQGILQPLVVRSVAPPREAPDTAAAFEIVAGERRWRAAKLAGLTEVPVIVRELDDQSALAVALIENVQREDLNPIDQAQSLSRLAREFDLTHEQVAKAVGRSRAAVSNLLRLLELNAEVKDLLARGGIDMGHARALLPLDTERQLEMARRAEKRGLSVRQVEKAVRGLLSASEQNEAAKAALDMQARWLQQQLASEIGEKVAIRQGKDGRYTLNVGFGDLSQLLDALERIQELIGQVRDTAGPRARDAS